MTTQIKVDRLSYVCIIIYASYYFTKLISETLWLVEILKIRTSLYKISNIFIFNYAIYTIYISYNYEKPMVMKHYCSHVQSAIDHLFMVMGLDTRDKISLPQLFLKPL